MTLIGRKILLTNTDASGNPTLDFPITSIECVEGGASQEDLDTTNNALTENTTNLQTLQTQLTTLTGLVNNLQGQLEACVINSEITIHITESYRKGTDWYRVWSNGWIEQGGSGAYASNTNYTTVTLLIPFVDINYSIITGSWETTYSTEGCGAVVTSDKTITSFNVTIQSHGGSHFKTPGQFYWYAIGQGAVVL